MLGGEEYYTVSEDINEFIKQENKLKELSNEVTLKNIWSRITWIVGIVLGIIGIVAVYLAGPLSSRVVTVEHGYNENVSRISVIETNTKNISNRLDDHIIEQREQFKEFNQNIKDGFDEVKQLIRDKQ